MKVDVVRIGIGLFVVLVSGVLRSFVVFVWKAWTSHIPLHAMDVLRCVSRRNTGKISWYLVPDCPLARNFRALGWDLAGASWGLFVMALMSTNSQFSKILMECEACYRPFLIIFLFIVFLILYILAIIARFVGLETAEKFQRHRWICSVPCVLIGSTAIYGFSKLALP